MIYLYDNTYLGLLNLINYIMRNRIEPLNIKDLNYSPTLLEDTIYPKLGCDEALCDRIINKIGNYAFSITFFVFLSNEKDKELLIYKFLNESLKYKKEICFMRNIDSVSKCLKIVKYVKSEAHRLKGFVRFKELKSGILYSEIEPENNIIVMLSNHFKNRLKNERWIIKDNKRNIISIYNGKNYCVVDNVDFNIDLDTTDDFEDMWKVFYKTIGIKERKNDRCRMNFMPKKYWKYMLEVCDEENSK